MLKTYNQSNIEQLGMCTVKFRHKDICFRCSFFVVPGAGPALLGMPGTELLNILRITCDQIGDPYESRKSVTQRIDTSDSPSGKTNGAMQINIDRADACNDKIMFQLMSGLAQRVADKRASEVLRNKMQDFSDVFHSGIGCFEGTLTLQVKEGN